MNNDFDDTEIPAYTDNFWAEPTGLRVRTANPPIAANFYPLTAADAVATFEARVRPTWWIEHQHLDVQESRVEERDGGWWLPLGAGTGANHSEDEAFYRIGRHGDARLVGQPLWWDIDSVSVLSRVGSRMRELLGARRAA